MCLTVYPRVLGLSATVECIYSQQVMEECMFAISVVHFKKNGSPLVQRLNIMVTSGHNHKCLEADFQGTLYPFIKI